MPEDEDFQMRSHSEDTSICFTPTSRNVQITGSLLQDAHYETADVSLNYSGVKEQIRSRNGLNDGSRIEQNKPLNATAQTPQLNLSYMPCAKFLNDYDTSQWESLERTRAVEDDVEDSFFSPQLFHCSSTPVIDTVDVKPRVKLIVSHRRSYRTSQVPLIEQISIQRSQETCTIEMHISSTLENLFIKVIKVCTWLGAILKEGLNSVYAQYLQHSVCKNCITYHNRLETLHKEIMESHESIKQQLRTLEQMMSAGIVAPVRLIPPPPPPPPPVMVAPTVCKTKLVEKRKLTETVRPIIAIEDIKNVKLRKVSDRPSSMLRRATEPNLVNSVKAVRPMKRQSSLVSTSSTPHLTADSPTSCLMQMLSDVDICQRKVKRLKCISPKCERE